VQLQVCAEQNTVARAFLSPFEQALSLQRVLAKSAGNGPHPGAKTDSARRHSSNRIGRRSALASCSSLASMKNTLASFRIWLAG